MSGNQPQMVGQQPKAASQAEGLQFMNQGRFYADMCMCVLCIYLEEKKSILKDYCYMSSQASHLHEAL